jgi:AhpD family alkylhydroperoxidase
VVPHYHELQDEMRTEYSALRDAVPGVAAGYAALHRAAMADGALSTKTKELVALAVAVTRQCDGCIVAHARSAARRGATAGEVAEVAGVCILMNGGPGTVYGAKALAAYEEFFAEASGSSAR